MKRRWIYVGLAVTLGTVFAVGSLLILDTWVRSRFPLLNRHGYTGPVLGAKSQGEYRIAVLGGSTVLGYGMASWREAFPAYLESDLQPHVRVANLGFNNQGTYSFAFTIRQYAYLRPDLVVFYEGYNDLSGMNMIDFRQLSVLFRWTGYYPMLPIVAGEKAMLLRVGDLRAAYAGKTIVFTPSLAQRSEASILEMIKMLDRGGPTFKTTYTDGTAFYLANIRRAIEEAKQSHIAVMVVGQPRINARHSAQQAALHTMLCAEYRDVPYVDVALDLHDPALCWDGMHLTADGNRAVAAAIASAVKAYRSHGVQPCH